jgi:hypothetical protein
MSAINGFFNDYGLEAIALGDLAAKVRKGLAASHAAIDDTPVRIHLPASIVIKALRIAKTLRLLLAESTIMLVAFSISPTRDQVLSCGHVLQ